MNSLYTTTVYLVFYVSLECILDILLMDSLRIFIKKIDQIAKLCILVQI